MELHDEGWSLVRSEKLDLYGDAWGCVAQDKGSSRVILVHIRPRILELSKSRENELDVSIVELSHASEVYGVRMRVIGRLRKDIRGQASVEYLLVGLALMIIVSVLALLVQAVSIGLFVEHASSGASHVIGSATAG